MKFSTRELVTMAVFGALWGLMEISLGSLLHAIKIPLTGMLLSTVGIMLAAIGRLFVPRKGSTLFIGVIATILKLFSIGSVVIGPMAGIITEALIAELILDVFPRPSRLAFVFACAGAALWTVVQPFVTGLLLFGRDLVSIWLDLLDTGNRIFHIPTQAAIGIVVAMAVLHLIVGGLGGWLGWKLGQVVRIRLGGTLPEPVGS